MSLVDVSRLGFGGTGIPDTLPAAITELQGFTATVVNGAPAGTVIVVPGMGQEDTISAILDLSSSVILVPATITRTMFGFTSTGNLSGKKLLVWWYDHVRVVFSRYQRQIVADGAIAYWPLNDPTGSLTARDWVGVWHGLLVGGVVCGQPGLSGVPAMMFDGTGLIEVPNLPAPSPQFSIEAWVKPEAQNLGVVCRSNLLAEWAGGAWELMYYQSFPGPVPRKYSFGWVSVADVTALDAYSSLPYAELSVWHHLVGTHDGSQGRLFVDGAQVASIVSPLAADSQPDAFYQTKIGVFSVGGSNYYNWIGQLADISYYQRALSGQDVAAHFALR